VCQGVSRATACAWVSLLEAGYILFILPHGIGTFQNASSNRRNFFSPIEIKAGETIASDYCPSRGLGEKPSPSGEDFSMHAASTLQFLQN
jgi:hypothetical protein